MCNQSLGTFSILFRVATSKTMLKNSTIADLFHLQYPLSGRDL